ncbi:flagellar hook-basal body protein [Luxibacter massiliensis]|uniref:flagellar hook-basal body protein n=1 Tax=Luxibacter massiliensis TaxID=2219695 RepID=UPI000F06FEA5|nr:flagellar hook-basal body protein [Luxibacter massiliensis]
MFQGFYDLASNMITQNRNMNVISNNMSNVSTPGYKSDKLVESTFREELLYRYDKSGKTPIGTVSRMNIADERVTNYSEGGLRETGSALDCGLTGNGFFAVQTDNGTVYTRNGSFNLDNNGYLVLQGVGRVLGANGGPIRLTTDDITIDKQGNITSANGLQNFGRLQIVDFADYSQLTKVTGGVFESAAQPQNAAGATVTQKYLEDSNVSMVDEMTAMMSGQRALQSSSQVLKMYDQLTAKMVQLGSM